MPLRGIITAKCTTNLLARYIEVGSNKKLPEENSSETVWIEDFLVEAMLSFANRMIRLESPSLPTMLVQHTQRSLDAKMRSTIVRHVVTTSFSNLEILSNCKGKTFRGIPKVIQSE